MADLSIDPVITPKEDEMYERNVSKSSSVDQDSLRNGCSASSTRPRRKSVGSNNAGGSALRSNAEKSESANSSKKLVPHYLRASTGSCHDLCKFGREHSFETKARKPFRKRIGKTFPNELSPIQILVSGGKKEEVISDKKEEEVSVKKKEEAISGGKKKEKVISGSEKKEKVISGGKKKEEVVSDGKKKRDIVSVDQKKVKVVSSSRKKEEVVSADRKKEEVVSADQKKEEVLSLDEETEEAVDHGTPTDTAEHSTYKKASPDNKSCPAKLETSLDKEKATACRPSTFTKKHSPNVPSQNKLSLLKLKPSSYAKTYSSKQNGSSGNETRLLKRKPSSAKKSPSADPPEIVKSIIFPYTEVADSVEQGSSSDNKTPGTVKKTASVGKQQLNPVKLKPVKVKPQPSDDLNGIRGKGRRNINAESGRKLMASKSSAKKLSTPPTTLTSKLSSNKTAQVKPGKSESLKITSSLKKDQSWKQRASGNMTSNVEKVSEKTLHVVRMETANYLSKCISGDDAISSSPPPSPWSAKPLVDGKSSSLLSREEDIPKSEAVDVEADALISENNDSRETSKEEAVNTKTMRKIRVVPEDKHTSPVQLKFKMGKVVDLQSDSNTPRKLRFRRARLLGAEDIKGDSRRKTSRRAGSNVDTAGTGNPTQKVVLKHQDVQGKKDEVLLNNVIEETASKLAVSRKSKVKALVGAFETVISLQEIKPSTQVVS